MGHREVVWVSGTAAAPFGPEPIFVARRAAAVLRVVLQVPEGLTRSLPEDLFLCAGPRACSPFTGPVC